MFNLCMKSLSVNIANCFKVPSYYKTHFPCEKFLKTSQIRNWLLRWLQWKNLSTGSTLTTLILTPGYHSSLAVFGCSRMRYVRTALQCLSNQHVCAGVGTMLTCSLLGHSNNFNINILLGSLIVVLLSGSRKLYICVLALFKQILSTENKYFTLFLGICLFCLAVYIVKDCSSSRNHVECF